MTFLTSNLHIIIPVAAAAFFMAVTGFVTIEEALNKH